MTAPRVVLRADAGGAIGVGHVMRSIALGGALVMRGAEVLVASVDLEPSLAARATTAGLSVVDVPGRVAIGSILRLAPSIVVVDGYLLGDLVVDLAAHGVRFGVIDDNHELPIRGAELVLNHNPHATSALYPDATPEQRLLLGASYTLIRSDVVALGRRSTTSSADRPLVLVALGGADPRGLTLGVTDALVASGCDVWVGIGATNPRRADIEALARRQPGHVHVDRGDLLEGYAVADVAVVGAGTSMWELGYLGIPGVAIVVADNQVAGARVAAEQGLLAAFDVREADVDAPAIAAACRAIATSPVRRDAMRSAGIALFDGKGAERSAEAILALIVG